MLCAKSFEVHGLVDVQKSGLHTLAHRQLSRVALQLEASHGRALPCATRWAKGGVHHDCLRFEFFSGEGARWTRVARDGLARVAHRGPAIEQNCCAHRTRGKGVVGGAAVRRCARTHWPCEACQRTNKTDACVFPCVWTRSVVNACRSLDNRKLFRTRSKSLARHVVWQNQWFAIAAVKTLGINTGLTWSVISAPETLQLVRN